MTLAAEHFKRAAAFSAFKLKPQRTLLEHAIRAGQKCETRSA
jgi:hypothetical protein